MMTSADAFDALPVWYAPAKLNLFLHVTGQRADGYHTLQTLFQFIDRADALRFKVTESASIQRVDAPSAAKLNLPDTDLCVQAARLLQKEAGISRGATIYLDKRLPAGGGLGGGSSDAATTLIALNHLWSAGCSREDLIQLGVQLGADVPIFVYGRSAIATGIGEQFQPYTPEEGWYVVLTPDESVSTAKIFSNPALTGNTPIKTIRGSLPPGLKNDLESVTCHLYPAVQAALNYLKSYGDARMTGSGASVFLRVESECLGQQILDQSPVTGGGFVARGVNRHPHAAI